MSKVDKNAYGLSVDEAIEAAGGVYAGGASEFADGRANGFATVAGFAGRLVGALKAANGDDGRGVDEAAFEDVFDTVLGVRSKGEVLLDLRLKILKEGMLLEDEFVYRGDAESCIKVIVKEAFSRCGTGKVKKAFFLYDTEKVKGQLKSRT